MGVLCAIPESGRPKEDASAAYEYAQEWLAVCNQRFATLYEQFSIGRKDAPFFANGSVPGYNAAPVALVPRMAVR